MTERAILRLIHKKVEPLGSKKIESRGLFGRQSWELKEYMASIDYLVIQYPGEPDAYKYESKELSFAPMPWRSFCRWHNGPLFERDEPWKRLYCVVESKSYCRQHKRSVRAMYEYCLGMHAQDALEACKLIDKIDRTEYIVYLTDAGSGRAKVGVTRSFRFLERLSEQAHNLATVLQVTDSLYEARRAEIMVSKAGIATQAKARRLSRLAPSQIAPTLSAVAERATRMLGAEWDHSFVRVLSEVIDLVYATPEFKEDKLAGSSFDLLGYWGGHIVLRSGDAVFHVNTSKLMHRDVLLVSRG